MRLPSLLAASWLALAPASAAAQVPATVTLSVVGTSDLHGRIAVLPWFGGYLGNLRAARERDGGGVVLVDAGDMFQGTLESNLGEGAAVIAAYNALGYAAAALGNHEFDFGPVGPATMPTRPGDDPRGALKARAAQARFPFLAANIVDRKTRRPVAWPNVRPSVMVTVAGIRVGIIGVASAATAHATMPANVAGLEFEPLTKVVGREARKLRARGAQVVIAVAHDGGACQDVTRPHSHSSCDMRSPIFALALGLGPGSVDAIVGGHTHQAIAHFVGSFPVIQSYANGRAFGRVDLVLDRQTGKLLDARIQPPRQICPAGKLDACAPGSYEGATVTADPKLVALNEEAMTAARRKGEESLGVELLGPLPHRRGEETALGNLFADLVRGARPDSDVAVLNAGGMRAGLPKGPLTYGALYEAFPFDNGFARLRMTAAHLRARLAASLTRASSLVSLSGLRVRARCQGDVLDVTLTRDDGSPVDDQAVLTVTTSDFLATGGDGFFAPAKAALENGPLLREAMAEALRQRGGALAPDMLFDLGRPRLDLPGRVPIRCGQ